MAKNGTHKKDSAAKRKLGDEWADWDGSVEETSADTDGRVFIGLAMATIIILLGLTALFGWLIYPRLDQIGHILGTTFNFLYLALAMILILWLEQLLFIFQDAGWFLLL